MLAANTGGARLASVLSELRGQRPEDVEVLVCYPEGTPGLPEACGAEPWVTPVQCEAAALTPHLWRDGIYRARAPRVALSIVHMRPGPGWVEELLAADLDHYAAVGGSIDNEPASKGFGWAIYLLRYVRYAPPFEARETTDLPGDNALYDREAILANADAFADGFWEPAVHARLAAQGRRLRLDPDLVSVHDNAYSAREFACQRFAHGRQYGRDRALSLRGMRRLGYTVATPAVPLVLGSRVLARAARRRKLRWHLPRALPWLVLFLLAWGAGEMGGALSARRERGA